LDQKVQIFTLPDDGASVGLYIIAGIILLPLIEISVFIWVGELLGVLPTILLTVLTAMAGTLMLRQQGLSLLMRMQKELDGGRAPGNEVMQGAMIVLASILLLIPGFVTDAIGLLLFIPPVRESLAKFIIARSNVVIMEGGTINPPTFMQGTTRNTSNSSTPATRRIPTRSTKAGASSSQASGMRPWMRRPRRMARPGRARTGRRNPPTTGRAR
jgi:UPF0716 protein FxsA